MKTENTLENKAKFFAQYWGQTVRLYKDEKFPHSGIIPFDLYFPENTCLLLKPLSKISDEEAKSMYRGVNCNYEDANQFLTDYKSIGFLTQNESDFLRSKGYAIPWMDLSVEDLQNYGWIKLEEND